MCPHCHTGQFPVDCELDIVDTESSPGYAACRPWSVSKHRLITAASKVLVGLEVTTKAVHRTVEAIGGDIVQKQQQEIQRAVQLDLPMVIGESVPIL